MSRRNIVNYEDNTLEIDLPLTECDNSAYTEVSIFDIVKDEHTLRVLLDPFNVYPGDRTSELLRVIKDRSNADIKSSDNLHTDWLADDLGEGYDKDDPFIDDSEAPQDVLQLTTKLGGFYVSKGNVELVKANDVPEINNNTDAFDVPTLPSQIPEMLRIKIEQFVQLYTYLEDKEYVWTYEPALKLLRLIDNGSFNLSSTLRGRILSYLSYELQIKKASLLKKLRQIRCHPPNCAGDIVVQTMNKLRNFVNNEMPKQIKEREERIAYICNNRPIIITDKCANPIIENELPKVKKRYRWSMEDRNCFKELIKLKLSKISNDENVYEILSDFLENSVKPIWPKGWMSTNNLLRECKLFLPENTLPQAKKRKLPPTIDLCDDDQKDDTIPSKMNNTLGEESEVIYIPKFQQNEFNRHDEIRENENSTLNTRTMIEFCNKKRELKYEDGQVKMDNIPFHPT